MASSIGQGSGAVIVGAYRYLLWRTWDATKPRLLWVLLNPSTADATTDDPTLRRCISFSQGWDFGGLEIVNLFAFRTAYPQELRVTHDPVGVENDEYLTAAAKRATCIIVAWGENGTLRGRDREVLVLLARHGAKPPQCLGKTRNYCPRHPARLASTTVPVQY